MNYAVVAFSRDGAALLNRLCRELCRQGDIAEGFVPEKFRDVSSDAANITILDRPVGEWTGTLFGKVDGLIFIGAVGIAVRSIAPWLQDKYTDPAVVVVDDGANFAVSLLSGHAGRANRLTRRVAHILDVLPVITTSSDVHGLLAVDDWAQALNLSLSDTLLAKEMASVVLDGGRPGFREDPLCLGYCACKARTAGVPERPDNTDEARENDYTICVTLHREVPFSGKVLRLVPRIITVGAGCRKGVKKEAILDVIRRIFEREDLDMNAIFCLASVDLKDREQGLISAAATLGVPFVTFPSAFLDTISGSFSESEFVREVTGTGNICERAAYAAALRREDHLGAQLICKKYSENGITIALAVPVYTRGADLHPGDNNE